MRVSLIEHVGGHGGMDYYDYGLAYGLGENGLKVILHTCNETKLREYKNVSTVYTFGNIWEKNKVLRILFLFKSYYYAFKGNAKIVHVHLFNFTLQNLLIIKLAKFLKKKVVLTVHDVNSFYNLSKIKYEKKILKNVDGIIIHNHTSLKDLLKRNRILPYYAVIPHGNYLPFITPVQNFESSLEMNLLFFGQIKKIKGIDILLKALKLLIIQGNKVKLTIAGRVSRTSFKKYEFMIKDLGLTDYVNTILRYIEDKEVEQLYIENDLIVLPYKMVSQSGILLLSMSYGKPVLTSDIPAFIEIIKDGETGFTFKSGDYKNLAIKLDYIYKHRETLNKVTENANRIIRSKFDWINIGEATKKFYEKILE